MIKQCTKCKENKEISCFSISKNNAGGRLPMCKICRSKYAKTYYLLHKNRINLYMRNYLRKQRYNVLMRYSSGKMECACCGEKNRLFLSIDHIKGGGNQIRRKTKSVYGYLNKRERQKELQILCYNCNIAKGILGECPHKNKKLNLDFLQSD